VLLVEQNGRHAFGAWKTHGNNESVGMTVCDDVMVVQMTTWVIAGQCTLNKAGFFGAETFGFHI
jgi:hypothetical protein